MEQQLIAQQTRIESAALTHVTQALEVAISWVLEGDDCSRKLSSVRFETELFQRHLERLFALEELDGYMDRVSRLHPEWTNQITDLKREHEQFRSVVRKLVLRLDRISPSNVAGLETICRELHELIQLILEHNRRESEMLVESLLRDTGGQG